MARQSRRARVSVGLTIVAGVVVSACSGGVSTPAPGASGAAASGTTTSKIAFWDPYPQPDLLVAPVVQPGATAREVYLPSGARWTQVSSGRVEPGGRWVTVQAPIDEIPVFARDGRQAGRFQLGS